MTYDIAVNGPITRQTLDQARAFIRSMDTAARPLVCIRTWPEVQDDFLEMPGFRAVEDYDVEELDNMQRGEIGRVCGFHIIVRWNGAPVKTKSGKFRSEVTGGAWALHIDSEVKL